MAGAEIIVERGLQSHFVRDAPVSKCVAQIELVRKIAHALAGCAFLRRLRAPSHRYDAAADLWRLAEDAVLNVPEVPMPTIPLERATMIDVCAWCLSYAFQSGKDHDEDSNRVLTFFTQAVFMNHSCDPNAQMSDPGRCVTITALRDIRSGEEVTISYKQDIPSWPRSQRQEVLKHVWGFVCDCALCQSERICIPSEDKPFVANANAASRLKPRTRRCNAPRRRVIVVPRSTNSLGRASKVPSRLQRFLRLSRLRQRTESSA